MTLRSWFKKKALVPILFLMIAMVAIECFHIYFIVDSYQQTQKKRIYRLSKTLEIGFRLKSTNLLENLIETAYIELDPQYIVVCDKYSVVLSLPANLVSCPDVDNKLFLTNVYRPLLGTGNKGLFVSYSSFPNTYIFFINIGVAIFLMISFLIISYKLLKNMSLDIISPLLKDIFENKQLKIHEVDQVRLAYRKMREDEKAKAVSDAMIRLSQQVAHDIKSPIGAMDVAVNEFNKNPLKAKNLIESSLVRVKDIISDLEGPVSLRRQEGSEGIVTNMYQALREFIKEKRAEIMRFPFQIKADDLISVREVNVKILKSDLMRILSNIVNNSLEATGGRGWAHLTCTVSSKYFKVHICDNGPGIPEFMQEKVFEKGYSANKPHGYGLGLFHAKQTLLAAEGDLLIEPSDLGAKLTVVLKIA